MLDLDTWEQLSSNKGFIWLAPPWVEAFRWLAIAEKVSTANMLRRRGFMSKSISDTRALCGYAEELAGHPFIDYQTATSIWSHFFSRCRIVWCTPRSWAKLVESWRGVLFFGFGLILWRIAPCSILWLLWQKRNKRISKKGENQG